MAREKSLLPWLLGVSALGIALASGGVWILSRYLTGRISDTTAAMPRRSPERQRSSIEADLGAPLYPGARRRQADPPTATVEVPLEGSFRVAAAEFETEDSLETVAAFYRQKLGAAEEHRDEYGVQFVRKGESGENRVVLLRVTGELVRIRVVNVTEDSR